MLNLAPPPHIPERKTFSLGCLALNLLFLLLAEFYEALATTWFQFELHHRR